MDDDSLVGRTLGVYRLLALVGSGGMGQVYRARDDRLGRDVAVKTIARAEAGDPAWRDRFTREARLLALVSHPNVIACYDVGVQDGVAYFVTELLEGESLRQRLRQGAMPVAAALDLAAQMAAGLSAAHARGVVHRDVKPGNVFITTDGRAKVLDFGLARPVDPGGNDATTSITAAPSISVPGAAMGTPAYMAPEQARGESVDTRADVFAFGATLYEMITGLSPFARSTTADTISAVLNEPAPRLDAGGFLELDRFVGRCLEKSPAHRWQSMADLAASLQWLSERDRREDPIVQERDGPTRRRWWLAAAVIAGVAGAGLAGAVVARYLTPPATQAIERSHMLLPDGASLANLLARPIISPDGDRLVFAANVGPTSFLFLKSRESADAVQLPNTEGARHAAFSPDGQFLAFLTARRLQLLRMSTHAVQDLGAVPGGSGYVDWSTNDEVVFSFNAEPDSGVMTVRVPADGAGVTRVTTVDPAASEHSHFAPQRLGPEHVLIYSVRLLPRGFRVLARRDGEAPRTLVDDASGGRYLGDGWLAFQRGTEVLAQRLDLSSLTLTGATMRIADDVAPAREAASGTVHWSVHASVFAYLAQTPVSRRLVWIARDGQVMPGPTGRVAAYQRAAVAPTGDRLALSYVDQPRIWLRTIGAAEVETPLVSLETQQFLWAPGGDSWLAIEARSGQTGIYRGSLANATISTIVKDSARNKHFGAFTKDGSALVFSQDNGAPNGMDIMVKRGDALPAILIGGPADDRAPGLSADSRWMSFLRSGILMVAPYPAGSPATPVAQQAFEPRWSASGSELYFRQRTGEFRSVIVRPDGTVRPPETLFTREFLPGTNNYDVAPDGRLLFIEGVPRTRGPHFSLIRNWRLPR